MTAIPAESQEELEKLERKHAENPEGRYFVPLANAYRKNGDLDRSMALLREGLERHPDYLSAHIVLGRCLADRGDTAGAESEFRYVLSLDPQNLIALRTLGELALADGRMDDARESYRDLLNVDPMNEDARRALETLQAPPAAVAEWAEPGAVLDGYDAEESDANGRAREDRSAPDAVEGGNDLEALFGTTVDFNPQDGTDAAYPQESDAVVTETIAELYTRQGFYDRAADVYRELIRRRGPEPRLEERLREVEQFLARGSDVAGTSAGGESDLQPQMPDSHFAPQAEPEPDALAGADTAWLQSTEASPSLEDRLSGDPFADSFVAGFPAVTDVSREAPIAEEPSGESLEEGYGTHSAVDLEAPLSTGESISDYLRAVISWRPSPAAAPARSEAEAETQDEPGEQPAQPGGDYPGTPDTSDEDLFPWELPSFLPSEPGDSAFSAAVPMELDDRFPFEEDSTSSSEEGSTSSPEGGANSSLEEASTSSFEDVSAPSLSEPEISADIEPTRSTLGEPHPPVPGPSDEGPAAPAPEAQRDNDDLDSFQAWLRSLKR